MAYHIHFGPRCSLALLCSFEARRHALQLRQAGDIHTTQPTLAPGSCDTLQARQMPVNPPAVREEKDTDEKEKEEQSRRLSEAMQRLQPDFGPKPRRPRRQVASASPAQRRTAKSHPFLEHGTSEK
eukprot:symbB.v1.2.018155.t2/scaffold1415.1/size121899/8